MNQYENKANDEAVDSLLNFETVKYFNNEEHEIRRYRAILEKWNEANLKSQWALAGLNSGQALIVSISLVVVMILAAFEVKNGTMSLGDFVLVNTFLLQLYTPLNLVANTYRITKTALVDLENMFSLLQEPIDVKDMENAPELEVTRAEIEFQDVTFSYESDKAPVLRGVSFKVPGGTKLAIVGATGAGKSTISRLLFRFYDVNSGSILIDGQDISRVTQSSLRKAIGMVPQDTVLFNETIRYNIAYGKVDATEDEIIQAAKMAQIHNFIMECPDRYETLVGERGLRLSGGERQRVGIARAILKNPPILIFDEATSALDSATEKEIQNSLAEVAKGKTTIVIAHRLSTIVDADRIIVLKDGVIVESGTHTELLMKGGEYARLWAIQSQQQQQKKSQNNNSADLLITL
jgi:ABC-type transport system involved in Fe-S cluster assembly fused permease/ATPase subunit